MKHNRAPEPQPGSLPAMCYSSKMQGEGESKADAVA